jgi:hypothetical protein
MRNGGLNRKDDDMWVGVPTNTNICCSYMNSVQQAEVRVWGAKCQALPHKI